MIFIPFFLNSIIPYKDVKGGNNESFSGTGVATTKTTPVAMIICVMFVIVYSFLYSYGAARLSWNYNISVGNTTGDAFFNSLMAYIFSSFYYPFYALILKN